MSDIEEQRKYYERMMDEVGAEYLTRTNHLKAENERLREENQHIGLIAYELGRTSLAQENDKLRELVREMMRFFEDGDWCTTCESAKECEAQEQYAEDCLIRGIFHDRMRELGVEVDA